MILPFPGQHRQPAPPRHSLRKGKLAVIAVLALCLLLALRPQFQLFFPQESTATLSKVGSQGDEVRQIQTKLNALGYNAGKVTASSAKTRARP